MNILTSCVSTFIELVCIFLINRYITSGEYRPGSKDIIFALLDIIFVGTVPDSPGIYSLIVGQLIIISYFVVTLHSDNLSHPFILYCFVFFIITIIQTLLVITLGTLGIVPTGTWSDVICCLATLALLIISMRFISYKNIYEQLISSPYIIKTIIINTYLIVLAVTAYMKIDLENAYDSFLILSVILCIIFVINIGILYYDFTYEKKIQMLASYEKNQSIYEDLINDIRSNQHEYTIRNPSDKMYTPMKVDEFFKKKYTTKKGQSHGYGLYNLLSNVIKNDGMISADCVYFAEKNWMVFELVI